MNKEFIKYDVWILLIVCLFFSCNKEPSKKLEELPVEKLYIVECDFFENRTSKFFMDLFGFCELDKNFKMKIVAKSDDGNFYTAEMSVPDSLRQMLSGAIKNYWIDTAYLSLGEYPAMNMNNGNNHIYFLIMEKEGSEKTIIRFRQNALPKDLCSVYKYLYYDQRYTIGKDISLDNIDSLHRVFDKELIYNLFMMPSSIEFTIPDIINK